MHLFDAEPQIIKDFKDESDLVAGKEHSDFKVWVVRHPTLGKVVIVEGRNGGGIIVETEE